MHLSVQFHLSGRLSFPSFKRGHCKYSSDLLLIKRTCIREKLMQQPLLKKGLWRTHATEKIFWLYDINIAHGKIPSTFWRAFKIIIIIINHTECQKVFSCEIVHPFRTAFILYDFFQLYIVSYLHHCFVEAFAHLACSDEMSLTEK